MKFETPPETSKLEDQVFKDFFSGKYSEFLQKTDQRYFYWDEIKHRKDLPYKDPLITWSLVKLHRQGNYKKVKFGGEVFHYFLTTPIQQYLHEFDLKLIVGLYKSPITEYDKAEYLKNSILEEAVASSQIEGAATTTEAAFDMLKKGREPRDESEQMIFNNLRGIRFIKEEVEKPLTKELIIEIHRMMTANTSAEYCAGGFRKEQIYVQDHVDGEIAHVPPSHDSVDSYINDLVDFVNSEKAFMHPIIKASIIHFMFGYIHPFMDGNGRTARALFYWYLIKKEYSLIENVSISRAILNSRTQYDKAFLKTENDNKDLTYFINYSMKNLRVAFESLIKYRDKKKTQKENANLIAYKIMEHGLLRRQADLIGFLFGNPKSKINLTAYSEKHNIVRQTARKDLNELLRIGLIKEEKEGRNKLFSLSTEDAIAKFLEK
ncbi:MAG: Fic family protein [Bacteroidetes bacterium]|nr:Fic family protein [Bacteroidota bacterium]